MTYSLSALRRWLLPGLLGGLLACHSGSGATTLLRLQLLADELTLINDKVGKANNDAVESIQTMVEKNHNLPKDVQVLRQCVEVRTKTQQLRAYLRELQRQLSPAGETPTLAQLADTAAVAELLLRGGQADTLQRRLDRYAAFIRQYISYSTVPPLTATGDDPRIRAIIGEKRARRSFRELFFQDASVGVALAVLARQEAAVLRRESDALRELSMRVGSGCGFDKIGVFAAAESNVVAEGETYRAEMFLTTSATGARPRMMLNGQPLVVGPDGKGHVALTAPRLAPGQNRQTVTWEGAITLPNRGRDTTFRVRVPYTIIPRR